MCLTKVDLLGDKIIPIESMLDFGENYQEIQPGLAVCLSASADLPASGAQTAFEGDNKFIHLNFSDVR